MNIWGNMQEEMEKVMLEYAPGIELFLENSGNGILHGRYTHEESICLFLPTILETWDSLKEENFFDSPILFAWAIFSHELGHHIDYIKTNGYESLKKTEEELNSSLFQKEKNLLKNSFRMWLYERYEVEKRAWKEAYRFLPAGCDINSVKQYEEDCLETYIVSWRIEYRKYLLIQNMIQKTPKTKIKIMFWNQYENIFHFEKETNTLYLNVSDLVTRPKTITQKDTTTTKELLYWISYYDSLVQKQQLA